VKETQFKPFCYLAWEINFSQLRNEQTYNVPCVANKSVIDSGKVLAKCCINCKLCQIIWVLK